MAPWQARHGERLVGFRARSPQGLQGETAPILSFSLGICETVGVGPCVYVCVHVCVCVGDSIWALIFWIPLLLGSGACGDGGSGAAVPSLEGIQPGPPLLPPSAHPSTSLPLSPAPSSARQTSTTEKKECLEPAINGRKLTVSFSSCSGIHPALGH